MKLKFKIWILIVCMGQSAHIGHAQDTVYARQIIQKLCSEDLHGRGYYKQGAPKAAAFIQEEMKKTAAVPLQASYLQSFEMQANVIRRVELTINGKILAPGKDYLVSEDAPSSSIRTDGLRPGYQVQVLNNRNIEDSAYRMGLLSDTRKHYRWNVFKLDPTLPLVCIVDTLSAANQKKYGRFLKLLKLHVHSVFLVQNKLTWSVAAAQVPYVSFEVLRSAFPNNIEQPLKVAWTVRSKWQTSEQYNVVGTILGIEKPDSFLMITAHYDHLGQMGEDAIFYGANDNAAGVAMTLDLMRYYSLHPPRYTIVFIAFGGEEAGLLGSYHYSKFPMHNLLATRGLVNLDLVGTGETGMTVVNATIFPQDFALLESINAADTLLPEIRKRGKAANSDHYYFSEMGIPSFFWYQSGPRSAYHDVVDVPETLSLAGYNATFQLLTRYFRAIESK